MRIAALLFFLLLSVPACAQDWSKPDLLSSKTEFMTEMHDLVNQCAKQDFTTGTNIPTSSIRYNRSTNVFQEYNGSSWSTAPINGLGIEDNTITTSDLLANSVGTAAIDDNTITSADILNGTIASTDIADDTINQNDIATGGVGSLEIDDGAVTATEIQTGAVISNDILDGTIVAADIADNTISSSKLSSTAATRATLLTTKYGELISTTVKNLYEGNLPFYYSVMPRAGSLTHLTWSVDTGIDASGIIFRVYKNGVEQFNSTVLTTAGSNSVGPYSFTAGQYYTITAAQIGGTVSPNRCQVQLWGIFTN